MSETTEAPETPAAPETPPAALARMLAAHALLDVARPDLLAIAERNLFGPPTERVRRPVAPRPAAREQQQAGPPTFRVSIGRLDIVAPPPAVPEPVSQRAEPKTSLQGYLERRRQGRS